MSADRQIEAVPGLCMVPSPGTRLRLLLREVHAKLGFTFGEPWDGFYAIGELDGLELHLPEISAVTARFSGGTR